MIQPEKLDSEHFCGLRGTNPIFKIDVGSNAVRIKMWAKDEGGFWNSF